MALGTDIFLSHNWGKDELGRDNHQRVSLINKELKECGYETWFDEEKMEGNIVKQMCQGIDQTKGIIVFITRRYLKKVNGEDNSDNCKLEFNYASRRKTSSKMVAVVMDKSMHDTKTWTGSVGMHLGGEMYVDMSGDLENKTYITQQLKLLQRQLQSKGIRPLSEISLVKRFLNAAKHSDVSELLEMLDAGISVDISSEIGFTALMQAAKNNDIDVTCLLLQKSADVNKQSYVGWTALHWAAYSNSTDAIRVLLQHGASTNIKNNIGYTPLDRARASNKEEAVRLLE